MTAYPQQSPDEHGAVAPGGAEVPESRAAGRGSGAALPVFDAVVLAGGAAKRLGGVDKPSVSVGGRSLLDRVLAACAGAAGTVVVGSRRPTARPVMWAREEPPGGGPLAALHAGLRRTTAERVVVLSADLPFLDEHTVRRLLATLDDDDDDDGDGGRAGGLAAGEGDEPRRAGNADTPSVPAGTHATGHPRAGAGAGAHPTSYARTPASRETSPAAASRAAVTSATSAPVAPQTRTPVAPPAGSGAEGVVLLDRGGRDQPLVGAYRSEPLRREIALLAAEHGGLSGLPLRLLISELTLNRISDPVASFDCDTWDAIAAARSRIREHEHVLDEWISAVKDELGLDLDFDVDTGGLLDLTRDVAHGVARPAGPLTTFLVGYAAARQGGGPEAVADAVRKATALAARWADEGDADAKPDAG